MPNANSTGSGVPSIRSINVRANLLSEWTTDQVRFRSEAIRYALAIVGMVAVAGMAVPFLEQTRKGMSPAILSNRHQLGELKGLLAAADQAKKDAAPQLDSSEVTTQTRTYFNHLVGELYSLLNAANSNVVFDSAKIEIRAAEMQIDCKAQAASFEAAQTFASTAGKGSHKMANLASIRPGDVFKNGISFDYLKRVEAK